MVVLLTVVVVMMMERMNRTLFLLAWYSYPLWFLNLKSSRVGLVQISASSSSSSVPQLKHSVQKKKRTQKMTTPIN